MQQISQSSKTKSELSKRIVKTNSKLSKRIVRENHYPNLRPVRSEDQGRRKAFAGGQEPASKAGEASMAQREKGEL